MNDDINGQRANGNGYDGFNLLADSMVNCVRNLPEAKRVDELNKLTYSVGNFILGTPSRKLPLRDGINSYLKYLALINGRKDKEGVAALVAKLSEQKTPDSWMKVFRGEK